MHELADLFSKGIAALLQLETINPNAKRFSNRISKAADRNPIDCEQTGRKNYI